MTLIEKYKTLTPKQKEKFLTVKNEIDFEAFIKEFDIELSDELKTKVLAYINTNKLTFD